MRLNPVYLFFGLLLIYLIARVIAWTGQTSVAIYTVPAAVETAGRTDYRGLIVRDEQSVTAEASGTVEYLAPENEKTAVGQEVCLIDTDGSVASLLSDDSAEAISGAASAEIRKRIRAAGQEAGRWIRCMRWWSSPKCGVPSSRSGTVIRCRRAHRSARRRRVAM